MPTQSNPPIHEGQPGFRWTVEAFTQFWEAPDLGLVPLAVTTDVAGYWPRTQEAVRGPQAYTRAIAELLSIVPNFRGRAVEHCGDGNCVFVRWEAEGNPPVGPSLITGVDRVLLRDGLVAENRIYSDHPVFELLAARLAAVQPLQK